MNFESKKELVYFFNKSHKHIEIFEKGYSLSCPDENKLFVVNWSAIGSVNEKIARDFSNSLQEAIAILKVINEGIVEEKVLDGNQSIVENAKTFILRTEYTLQ